DGQCLLDRYVVENAPSASVRAHCRRRADAVVTTGFFGCGNPLPSEAPLPWAQAEIEAISRVLGDDVLVLLALDATKDRVVEAVKGRRLVHFACHGSANFFEPGLSGGLSLANGEVLTAREISTLDIGSRVAVVSACESGVIQGPDEVDEALSVAAAFLLA